MKKGSVFFHNNFKFSDGEKGEKLLIVLNSNDMKDSDTVVCCKTTSKMKYGLINEGCYNKKNIYIIEKSPFERKTWVQFDPNSIFLFSAQKLLDCHFKKEIELIGYLEEQHINAIVNCFKRSDDISPFHLSLV
ncbi:MAG: hypothetical protein Q7K21_02910 [Elusimicrobiota bacterium]|nr:hypothetical protein [Elusimicrobiota bacterium]